MRVVRWIIAIVTAAGIFRVIPLFHVVRLKPAVAEEAKAAFNATQFAENLWATQLLPSLGQSVKAAVLLPAIQADAAAARKKFSHSPGLGDTYFYFLSGAGRVVAVSDDEVSLAVTEGGSEPEVSLKTGLIFGDALRDGAGLLHAGDFANSQDFNDISAALNHIVETRVLPKLRNEAKVGERISFVGCAEVDDESTDLKPLNVIPIETELQ